ncbi:MULTISPECIES: hypothetical protein [unclassified Endozoicomonas]|uniref:hypothetical protein n=1 Tax=unclassified Endozoicomonas TaxID=2644528 RepID=UPI002148F8AE|nr:MULTISPECIES: hypothetical protein [unclassified Endozoicomonas]
MKYLKMCLLILALPLQASAEEMNQEMIHSAATAYGLDISGQYPSTAEENRASAIHEQMLAAGVIGDDHTVDRAFSEAYTALGSKKANENFSQLCEAYKLSASENKPSAEDVLNAMKALEFGRHFNAGIEASRNRDDGFVLHKTPSFIKKGIKALLPSHSRSFRKLIEHSHARTMIFNINKDLANILGIGSKARNDQVKDIVGFAMNSKDSRLIRSNAGNAEGMSKGFNAVAGGAGLQLSKVDPGKVVSHYSGKSQADVIIAAVTEHAAKHEDIVYLLAFYGQSKYQYFTVSISRGFINITFAADDNRPVPVIITSMPASRVDYSTMAAAIDDFMRGKDEVPDLLGIWRMADQ